MTTIDPIDAIAGTRRRAVVAKVLRDRHHAEQPLRSYIEDAAAVLRALDEDINDTELAAMMTPEQVRIEALKIAVVMYPPPGGADQVVGAARHFAAFIADEVADPFAEHLKAVSGA